MASGTERPLTASVISDADAFEIAQPDPSKANGSSIAFLAEHDGRGLLLAGDAHPEVLCASLDRLAAERGVERIRIHAFKVSHHGGKHNLSSDLLDRVECGRWLFSTSGQIFGHPDAESVARIVVRKSDCELVFNYRSEENERWDSGRLRRKFRYRGAWPEPETAGMRVDV